MAEAAAGAVCLVSPCSLAGDMSKLCCICLIQYRPRSLALWAPPSDLQVGPQQGAV
jgi:hypothetical protein